MSLSLRDQLLQAGLISEKQAKEAEKKAQHSHSRKPEQARNDKQRPRPGGDRRPHDRPHANHAAQNEQRRKAEEARRAAAAEKAQAASAAQSQERERLEREKVERKARRAEIKQLIEQHRVKKPDSDDRYNFLDGNRIRRISVDAALRTSLGEGKLLIVRNEGRYEIVPAEIAERIRVLDERSVMGTVSADQQVDENDPYKDFVVPDDLMW